MGTVVKTVVLYDSVQRNQNMCRDHRFRESVVKQRTRKKQADVEVVDLLDTDEPTDNSSDEDMVVTKTPDIMANVRNASQQTCFHTSHLTDSPDCVCVC